MLSLMSYSILLSLMFMFGCLFNQINSSSAFSFIKRMLCFRLSYQFDYFVEHLFGLFNLMMIHQLAQIDSQFDLQTMISLTKTMYIQLCLKKYLYFNPAKIDLNCYFIVKYYYYQSHFLVINCYCSINFTIIY